MPFSIVEPVAMLAVGDRNGLLLHPAMSAWMVCMLKYANPKVLATLLFHIEDHLLSSFSHGYLANSFFKRLIHSDIWSLQSRMSRAVVMSCSTAPIVVPTTLLTRPKILTFLECCAALMLVGTLLIMDFAA